MGDFKVAMSALRAEESYLRTMADAQSSLSSAIVGMPAQVQHWGPWSSMQGPMSAAFQQFNTTISSSKGALDEVADLIRDTANAYEATEAANTVPGGPR